MEIDLDQIIEELSNPAAQDSKSWVSRTKIHEKINELKPKINTATSPTSMELIGILELVRKSLETEKMARDKEKENNKPILEEHKRAEKVMDASLLQSLQVVEDIKDELSLENVITAVELYGAIVEEQRIIEQYKTLDPTGNLRYEIRHIEGWIKDTEELDKKNQKRIEKILSKVGKGVPNGFRKK